MKWNYDNTTDINEALIVLEAQLCQNNLDKQILIKEAFLLWYILVEGVPCESFTTENIENLLAKNYLRYNTYYIEDGDYSFIIGWMMSVAFWYFNSSVDEGYGTKLLVKAYRSSTKNHLFKWAVRNELNLRESEIAVLRINISLRFDELYNYGPFIKDYFLDVINS